MRKLLTTISFAFVGLPGYGQFHYLSGEFNSDYVKITNPDTIFCGNYRSYDDGSSWTEIFDGSDNLDNYFNTQIGLVERYDTLFKTTNAGDSWIQEAIISGLNDIRYSDNVNVLYGYRDYPSLTGPASELIKSTDGGSTWMDMTLPFYTIGSDTMSCAGMSVVSEDTVFYVMQTSVPPYILFSTYDGGTTWDTTATGFFGPFQTTVYFVNSQLGFIGTGASSMERTEDGGESWNTLGFCPEIRDMSFVDDKIGYVIGLPYTCSSRYHTYKTTDGGLNWDTLGICSPCGDTSYVGLSIDAYSEDYVFASAYSCEGVYKHDGTPCPVASTEEFSRGDITLYPNPAEDVVFIEGLNREARFEVRNSLGQIVSSGVYNKSGIDVKTLDKGLYLIRFEDSTTLRFLRR